MKVPQSLRPHGLVSPWTSPGQNTGVGSLSLLQGIFPTQGWNPGLPQRRRILYQLSHQGRKSMLFISGSHSAITSLQKASDSMSCLVLSAALHPLFFALFLPRSVQEQDKKDKTSSHPGAPSEHSSARARQLEQFHGLVPSAGSPRSIQHTTRLRGHAATLRLCPQHPPPTPGDEKRLTEGTTEKP